MVYRRSIGFSELVDGSPWGFVPESVGWLVRPYTDFDVVVGDVELFVGVGLWVKEVDEVAFTDDCADNRRCYVDRVDVLAEGYVIFPVSTGFV